MSRPLRIQYPGAWYHVMNRGQRDEIIFKDKDDYYSFIDLLKDVVDVWNANIAAYCLMAITTTCLFRRLTPTFPDV